jgi:hypothetical protein
MRLINLMGLPAHISSGGMFFETTLPAPMIALSPIFIPLSTIELAPIKTSSPMEIGAELILSVL